LNIPEELLGRVLEGKKPCPELPFTITPLAGDASDRQYFRINWERPGPQSIVLMKLAQRPSPPELPFIQIQEHLCAIGVPVPELYSYSPELGIVLLEDLGGITLENKVKDSLMSEEEIKALYLEAIDILLQMQIQGSRPGRDNCPAFQLEFDVAKFMYELNFFRQYMIEGFLNKRIARQDQAILEEEFSRLCQILAQEKKYFTHRDYHSRNIMVREQGLWVLDFQDARLGLCQYDLASLLRDSYVTLPEGLVEELLEYYLVTKEILKEQKIAARTEFRRLFDFTAVQRNLKALGTFAFQKVEKGKDTYLPYIAPTLAYVWQNLDKYPFFNTLKKVLKKYLDSPGISQPQRR